MKVIRNFSNAPQGTVLALGNFDGVHLGHQAILHRCIETAKKLGAPPAVMTFEPHPREFFARGEDKLRIYPFRRKAELIRDMGIETLFLVRFNKEFASLSAESFITDILHKQLAVRHVITGENFAFGRGRGGNTGLLAGKAAELGFGFTACAAVHDKNGSAVSSSAIRAFLAAGDVGSASVLLGRPYSIEGHVIRGEQRGRELGVPTANIALHKLFKPRFGVYAVRCRLPDGTWHNGVASIGVKPTFGLYEPLLEAHLFDIHPTLYGQRLRVECIEFLREEKRFESIEALKTAMAEDCKQARSVL